VKIRKKLYKTIDGYKIYLVNGADIRKSIDISFALGNHGFSGDKYVPKHQVWIDDKLTGVDLKAIMAHELAETNHMKHGVKYTMAHALATKVEKRVRQGKPATIIK
jgi:hypothetical protein